MEQALTVSQLNQYIRMRLERDEVLQQICLCGELSNVTLHRSGHIYLKIKDEQSVISGVMFRYSAATLDFVPKEGQRVIVYGAVTVYEPSGSYQIKISAMRLDGKGQLYLAFQQLKDKLEQLGLFDQKHKIPLPRFPKKIGVITSPTGAAIRDIIRVCERRYPQAEIVLYPSLVQGEQAAESLRNAIEWFDINREVDVLIIGRGGGSIEDLWPFNDEELAYSIYNCEIPTVSAVGHETDYTICDFVSDVRAATPSMAAELVCPDSAEFLERIHLIQNRMCKALDNNCDKLSARFDILKKHPIFRDEDRLLTHRFMKFDEINEDFCYNIKDFIKERFARFEKSVIKLNALSPLATLTRGYAAVYDQDDHILCNFERTKIGDRLTIKLKNTTADCTVEKVMNEK